MATAAEDLIERMLGLDAHAANAVKNAKALREEVKRSLVGKDDPKTLSLRLKHGATCVRFNERAFAGAETLAAELDGAADDLRDISTRWEASEEAANRLTRPVPRGPGWFTAG